MARRLKFIIKNALFVMLLNIRNKVGIDVCSEVVNSYLALSNRNLTLLMDYTGKLRVTKTLEKYLEIKL